MQQLVHQHEMADRHLGSFVSLDVLPPALEFEARRSRRMWRLPLSTVVAALAALAFLGGLSGRSRDVPPDAKSPPPAPTTAGRSREGSLESPSWPAPNHRARRKPARRAEQPRRRPAT